MYPQATLWSGRNGAVVREQLCSSFLESAGWRKNGSAQSKEKVWKAQKYEFRVSEHAQQSWREEGEQCKHTPSL